jgi:hypothetical protein
MSTKDKRDLESKYHTVDRFVSNIIDYAWKAIVMSVLVTSSKNDIIALIDDGLIGKSAEDRLRQSISEVANIA